MWSSVSFYSGDESPRRFDDLNALLFLIRMHTKYAKSFVDRTDFVSRRQQELSMEEAFREVTTEVLEAIQALYRENPRPEDRRHYDIVQRELERRK